MLICSRCGKVEQYASPGFDGHSVVTDTKSRHVLCPNCQKEWAEYESAFFYRKERDIQKIENAYLERSKARFQNFVHTGIETNKGSIKCITCAFNLSPLHDVMICKEKKSDKGVTSCNKYIFKEM